MFKRLVIIWLIVCSFGYATAWAFDSHIEKVDQDSSRVYNNLQSDMDMEHSSCDHCCHAGAHLLAVLSSFSLPGLSADSGTFAPYRQSWSGLHFSPSERPPRV